MSAGDIQPMVIEVEDVNDERPHFINAPRPFQAVVPIDAMPGQSIYKFEAIDPDRDAIIKYRLFRDNSAQGKFEVDENTGNVIVRKAGFDRGKDYVIYVRAEDTATEEGVGTSDEERLSIKGGERAPQFYESRYEIAVPENREAKSKITSVKALSFSDKEIRYELSGDGNHTFRIDAHSGDIYLEKTLDYDDQRNSREYRMSLVASEINGLSASVRLQIRVEDNNDNSPKFDIPTQQAFVYEDAVPGYAVIEVSATDIDDALYGEIDFYIEGNDNFTIEKSPDKRGVGVIRVRNTSGIDADRGTREYKLAVKAVDKGVPPRTGSALVRVFARNTNDEAPVFTQELYHASLQENAGPGMTVAAVVAKDIDGDAVTYGFAGGGEAKQGQFVIDKDRGVIQLHSLPVFLTEPVYTLRVTAVDDGSCCRASGRPSPQHTAEATVVVSVTDVNDNKPYFPNCTEYKRTPPALREESPSGTYVTTVRAIDADSGQNGDVTYAIETYHDQPKMFSIDARTGVITTYGRFDREASRYVSITVLASDNGYRPLIGGCSFKIELLDVNDNAPEFQRELYDFTLKQDTPKGHFRYLMATDKDAFSNAEIEYSLESDSRRALELFGIENGTGWLFTKRAIPATPKEYRLRAVATDRGAGRLHSQAPVIVRITDVNSRPPVWESAASEVSVRETAPRNHQVAVLKARSETGAKRIFYELLDGKTLETNSEKAFRLVRRKDADGADEAVLHVYKSLDFERTPRYNLSIQAKNDLKPQLDTLHYLLVRLVDENDEVPLFPRNPSLSILEGEPRGKVVGTIVATDADVTAPFNKVRKTGFRCYGVGMVCLLSKHVYEMPMNIAKRRRIGNLFCKCYYIRDVCECRRRLTTRRRRGVNYSLPMRHRFLMFPGEGGRRRIGNLIC